MPTKQQLLIAFGVSLFIGLLTTAPLLSINLFSGTGLAYGLGGGLALFFGPLILCSIPYGAHWLMWKEALNGNELSLWVFWILSWFMLTMITIGEILLK